MSPASSEEAPAADARVVLITGSSRGIGRALVERYRSRGLTVVGCSRSELAHDPDHHVVDVTDEAAVRQLIAAIRKTHGRLDILINNAGITTRGHALMTSADSLRQLFETNAVGSFLVSREAAKLMRRNRWGRIVNFSTIAVPLSLGGEAAYVASKAAVEGLTGVLARDFAELGITVNAVGPGPVQTDLLACVSDEAVQALLQLQTLPRLGTFEDVANVVDFFIAEGSGLVTGQTIYLGGVR